MENLKITLDLWSVLLLFFSMLGFSLSFILFFHKRGNQVTNRFLSALCFVTSLMISEFLMYNLGIYSSLGIPIFIFVPVIFLTGPLYYFYILSFLRGGLKFDQRYLLHFIPSFLCFANFFDYYFTLITKGSEFEFLININGYEYAGLEIVQTGVYVLTAYRILNHYKSGRQIEIIKIKWLTRLSFVFIAYLGLKLIAMIYLFTTNHIVEVEYIFAISLSVIICVIGFSAIDLPEIISGQLKTTLGKKYQKSLLLPEQRKVLLERLIKLVESDKLYLNPELKLSDLSNKLAASANHLSQALNLELKKSFNEFINAYRIEEAKKKINGNSINNGTLLSLAFDSGFNSKTSFNRIFKKFTGQTPSDYIKISRSNHKTVTKNSN